MAGLPNRSMSDREKAKIAANAIHAALLDPRTAGERGVIHVDMCRPRRGVWLRTWTNIPGLMLDLGTKTYTHTLLPGWTYVASELRSEMIPDLEDFAATGRQPTKATR